MKKLLGIALALILTFPSLVFAQSVTTQAAGTLGSKFYSQAFTTVGANTFVVPSGVTAIFVTGCGAGGGGGGASNAAGGNGCQGIVIIKWWN